MKRNYLVIGFVVASFFSFATAIMADGIKAGQWTMTMVTSMPGMGAEAAQAMKEMENMSEEDKAMMQQMMGGMNIAMNADGGGMTTTITQCISSDDPVPQMQENDKDCTETHSQNGNAVQFEVVCPDSHSTGEVTYTDDSMTGTIRSQQMVEGRQTDVAIQVSGKYTGPCPQDQ